MSRTMRTKKKLLPGEMGVSASSNGRALTLDALRELPVNVMLREVESSLACGLRSDWMSGLIGKGKNKKKFSLTTGAGLGSKYLTFSYDGKDYIIDGKQMVEAIFAALGIKAVSE